VRSISSPEAGELGRFLRKRFLTCAP